MPPLYAGDPQGPWRSWWTVVIVAGCAAPVAAVLLFLAEFGGRAYWQEYLAAALFWCTPLAALSRAQAGLGPRTRLLALLLALAGLGVFVMGLPGFVTNPGWQF